MTRRASAITNFVNNLSDLALNGTPIRTALNGCNKTMTVQDGEKMLKQYTDNMKAHLIDIVEGNEEQAEALLAELKLSWSAGKSPNRQS